MRFLKKLLICIYMFMALFVIYCCVIFAVYQIEPTALIAGVMSGVGIESIISGVIKFIELKTEKKNNTNNQEN